MLRSSGSVDSLHSTLGQKYLAIAQMLVVDQRLLIARCYHFEYYIFKTAVFVVAVVVRKRLSNKILHRYH